MKYNPQEKPFSVREYENYIVDDVGPPVNAIWAKSSAKCHRRNSTIYWLKIFLKVFNWQWAWLSYRLQRNLTRQFFEVVLDCCHSGTGMGKRYRMEVKFIDLPGQLDLPFDNASVEFVMSPVAEVESNSFFSSPIDVNRMTSTQYQRSRKKASLSSSESQCMCTRSTRIEFFDRDVLRCTSRKSRW